MLFSLHARPPAAFLGVRVVCSRSNKSSLRGFAANSGSELWRRPWISTSCEREGNTTGNCSAH